MIACLRATQTKTHQSSSRTDNKWYLLVREVVAAQLSPYWANGRLEVHGYKLIITNSLTLLGMFPFQPISQTSFPFFQGSGSGSETTLDTNHHRIVPECLIPKCLRGVN